MWIRAVNYFPGNRQKPIILEILATRAAVDVDSLTVIGFMSKSAAAKFVFYITRNSYTMGCPSVRGDYPLALASGLSYGQVDKHGITILYHLHQCRPCTS